ncbi:class I SAM-dependent methyltransferase [Streptomyces sp. NPDC014744]|uniref:class I SAM-dependent methyltransferase n=1 Tax=Streptomyces sp. NPDC014744 TaxID=3364903 RepID=UPI0036FBA36E
MSSPSRPVCPTSRRPGVPVSRCPGSGNRGCSGPGVVAGLLADAFPDAEVVAVDQSPALLERARTRSYGRIATQQGGLPDEFGKLGAAGLMWSADIVHHLGDQQAALTALAAPGGLLAVAEMRIATRGRCDE